MLIKNAEGKTRDIDEKSFYLYKEKGYFKYEPIPEPEPEPEPEPIPEPEPEEKKKPKPDTKKPE